LLGKKGIQSFFYLDDILLWNPTEQEALTNTRLALSILQNLGLKINLKKSQRLPPRL
jgi:hypothetical protein